MCADCLDQRRRRYHAGRGEYDARKGRNQTHRPVGRCDEGIRHDRRSYIRSVSEKYHLPENTFTEYDFHIHIPEGAVPKDGPSAGITMATAILSAITKTPVKADVAMTGEITLRGRVLAIGGLKEKLLAAKTAGMKTVLVPKENEKDVEEISREIKNGLDIILVESMEEVISMLCQSVNAGQPGRKQDSHRKETNDY